MKEQVLRIAIKLDTCEEEDKCSQCEASILEGDQYITGIFGCCGNKCISWCLNCANRVATIVGDL